MMEVDELKKLLARPEWLDVEIKKSARDFPQSAASTICAFANSGGGYLILGVDETQLPSITGIDKDKIDDVQNQCIGLLGDIQKFSSPLIFDELLLLNIDGAYVLVIQIQDSKRQNKPVKVKLKGTWTAYIRKGSRDEVMNDTEQQRMLLDANSASITEQILDLDVESCFSESTLKWYRYIYERRHNQKHYELSHVEFLDQLGLIREASGDLKPTKASILLFGTERALNHILSRKVVDAIWYNQSMGQQAAHERWADRRPDEVDSPNLFDAWKILSERFMYWSEQPFEIDETNLQRSNETPDYLGFREACVNVLVHQDFADQNRVPKIEFYKDSSRYWNPGDSLVDVGSLPSGQSASRNPLIIQTFNRIGLSERAGSGLRDIYTTWQKLDRADPEILNSRSEKTFQITLGKKSVVSPLQQKLQNRIGVNLNDNQAQVFIACLASPLSLRSITSQLSLELEVARLAIDHLVRQGLLLKNDEIYVAADHFQEKLADLALKSDQASAKATKKVTRLDENSGKSDQATESDLRLLHTKLSKKQPELLVGIEGEMSLQQLMKILGQTHRTNFKTNQLQPLIDLSLVLEKHPGKPSHPEQAYYLSRLGTSLKALLEKEK